MSVFGGSVTTVALTDIIREAATTVEEVLVRRVLHCQKYISGIGVMANAKLD